MTSKLAGISSKDLEAKIKAQEEKLQKFLKHVDHLNPISMYWDNPPYLGNGARESIDGGVKLKDYHGFNIIEIFTAPERSARIRLEYGGKIVLDIFYQDHSKPLPSGMSETIREIRPDKYEKGPWEKQFNKLIEMKPWDAAELYRNQFEKIDETKERKRQAEKKREQKQLERSRLEGEARRLGL